MAVLWLLFFLLGIPLILLLVFLAISSCLGDRFRPSISGVTFNPRHGSYGRTYFRTMTHSGPALSEQIEMESMLNEGGHLDFADD